MKFLILGASGMAGHMISVYLKEQGHDVIGFARRKVPFVPSVIGDATDVDSLQHFIAKGRFDSVVNCIGVLNQAAEQHKDTAVFLNSYLPHFLARITDKTNTQIIHLSTDCVFSGKTGGYTENSPRDGETFYDRTKALGELEDDKNITLRNSIIGPDINPDGIGLFNWFMKQNDEINGYTDALWTGMTTLQLAKTIEEAANQSISGLINMVPDHNISKYDLLKLFNRYFRNNTVRIQPYKGVAVNKTLIRTRFEFNAIVPDYETMISELADWMKTHSSLYPHYKL